MHAHVHAHTSFIASRSSISASMQCWQLHNESLSDGLDLNNKETGIGETATQGVHVTGLTIIEVIWGAWEAT